MKVKILVIVAAIIAAVFISINRQPANAQSALQSFSSDSQEFMSQMSKLFELTTDKRQAKEFLEKLEQYMLSIGDNQRLQHIEDCNLLAKRKARAYPDYNNYFATCFAFNEQQFFETNNFVVWHNVFCAKVNDRKVQLRQINQYLKESIGLVVDQTLSQTASLRWSAPNSMLQFIQDGNDLLVDVGNCKLVCFAQNDSIEVFQTSGRLNFETHAWRGHRGKVTWHRSGFAENICNATFGAYKIDMSKSLFKVDSVKFVNYDYFPEALVGNLEYKVMKIKSATGTQYPKFRTSGEQRSIKNIFNNVDYIGGFSQIGARFIGSGDVGSPASVRIFRNDTLFIEALSMSFTLLTNRIESKSAAIVIHLDTAEITHPGLMFRYRDDVREVTMLRGSDGLEKSPYFNTYHQVSMDVERILWKIDEPEMKLHAVEGAAQSNTLFESLSYYREEDYNQLQGMEMTHPLQNIKDFYRYSGGQPFTVSEYADFLRLPESQVRQMIINLSFGGFIDYDVNTDYVTPRERLFDYLLFRLEKKDYDVIRFNSITEGKTPNGVLDLRNYDLKLNGVHGIAVSDYQNVALYPDSITGFQVLLKRNRDFRFDGRLDAGRMEMYGNDFYFSYENFEIELNKIDSLRIKVESAHLDKYGRMQLIYVQNTIADLSGTLQIDKPDNKSGIKRYPFFPILTSTKESYVYYDKTNIPTMGEEEYDRLSDYGRKQVINNAKSSIKKDTINTSYKRKKFYFAIDPFVIKDINKLDGLNTQFEGTLTSSIFPPFKQLLVVRPDYSLGFTQTTPPEGYPIYNNRARYFKTIDLSNRGLRGDGVLEYVTSKSVSNNFLFLLDEAIGTTYDFTIAKQTSGVPFPDVSLGRKQEVIIDGEVFGGKTEIRFVPFEEFLTSENSLGRFQMFTKKRDQTQYETAFSGQLVVTPNGLKGVGNVDMPAATLESSIIDFTDHTITADTSYFCTYNRNIVDNKRERQTGELRRDIIKESKLDKTVNTIGNRRGMGKSSFNNETLRQESLINTLCKENSKAHREIVSQCLYSIIDFDHREGYFTYKRGGGDWESSTVKYKTRLKMFTWDMDRNLQVMGQLGSKGNRFVSTKERGDSLSFYVPYAVYDGESDILECQQVKTINTADAQLNLNSRGMVVIHTDAQMDPLDSVKIEVNTKTSYHAFYNSKVRVQGAKKYNALGFYDFLNNEGKKYSIFMDSITTNKEYKTTARGSISESSNFAFDKYFAYKGYANILAGRQLLEFDGAAKMIHNDKYGPRSFVRFDAVIDPQKVLIPIDNEKIVNWNREQIHRNFFIRKDSTHVYSSFLESRVDYSDIPILTGSGYLFHNNIFDRFDICSIAKMNKPDTLGSILSFEPNRSAISGSGKLDMGVDFGKSEPVYIRTAGDIEDLRPTNTINLNTTAVVDFFFSTDLATRIYNKILLSKAEKCDTTSFKYGLRMSELYDTTQIKNIKATRWLPLDKQTQMLPENESLFTFDNMVWQWYTPKTAYICDTVVNIMMMRGRNVCRKVRVKSELVRRKVGSSFTISIEAGENWFFFAFRNSNMQVLTSDKEFNQALMAIDPSERRNKSRGIQYTLAPESKRKNFLKSFGIKITEEAVEQEAEEETDTDE